MNARIHFSKFQLGLGLSLLLSNSVALAGVSKDASGFTVVSPASDSRIIYVSSSGKDSNNGLSESRPVKTISKGMSLLCMKGSNGACSRHGKADQLLFKRGDTFTGTFGRLKMGGRSESEPLVIGSYGDLSLPRPVIKTGSSNGMDIYGGSMTPSLMEHIYIMGIHFYQDQRDPNSPTFSNSTGSKVGGNGLRFVQWNIRDLHVEDCKFDFFTFGIVIQGKDTVRPYDIRIRRNVIVDSYGRFLVDANGNRIYRNLSSGIYMEMLDKVLVEDNIFDHNGWNESSKIPYALGNIYNHNAYIQYNNTDVTVIRNTFLRASSHGVQLRPGGNLDDNLFIQNPIAATFGSTNYAKPGGVDGYIHANVILNGVDIPAAYKQVGEGKDQNPRRGWGITLENILSVNLVSNYIAHLTDDTGNSHLFKPGTSADAANCTFSYNYTWDWRDISTSEYDTAGPFNDPGRSVETYMASLGYTSSFDEFVKQVRAQRRGHWNLNFRTPFMTSYFRGGFKKQ